MKSLKIRMMTATAVAVLALPLVMAQAAGANTAPNLACGSTQPGPCSETAHFTEINNVAPPLPPTPGCPAVVSTDFVLMVGTGNGVEHATINKAQDAWFTMTFTGTATLTAYPPSSVTPDNNGNFTISGPPDATVQPWTGKLTERFGGEFNNKNAVIHGTFHFSGAAADGQTLTVGFVQHLSWTPGTFPNGPPHTVFAKVRCS
jgi:hypothetical protein